jgi:hypothetical protein
MDGLAYDALECVYQAIRELPGTCDVTVNTASEGGEVHFTVFASGRIYRVRLKEEDET